MHQLVGTFLSKLDTNRLCSLATFIFNAIALLVSMRLMSAYGSVENFTDYLFFTNVFGILLALDFGIQPAIGKLVRESYVNQFCDHSIAVIKTYCAIAMFVTLIFFILASFSVFAFSDNLIDNFSVFIFVGVQCSSIYLGQVYSSALKAFDKYRTLLLIQLVVASTSIVTSSFLVLILKFESSVPLTLAAAQLLSLFWLKNTFDNEIVNYSGGREFRLEWIYLKGAFLRLKSFSINSLSVVMTNQGQRLIMAKILGLLESAAMTSMMNLLGKIHQVCAIYSEILFYRAVGKDKETLFALYLRETLMIALISVLPISVFFAYGDRIYYYFLGETIGGLAVTLNPYVCIIIFIMCLSCPAAYLLSAIGSVALNTWYSIANALFFVLMIPPFISEMQKSAIWYVGILSGTYLFNALAYHLLVIKKLKSSI